MFGVPEHVVRRRELQPGIEEYREGEEKMTQLGGLALLVAAGLAVIKAAPLHSDFRQLSLPADFFSNASVLLLPLSLLPTLCLPLQTAALGKRSRPWVRFGKRDLVEMESEKREELGELPQIRFGRSDPVVNRREENRPWVRFGKRSQSVRNQYALLQSILQP